MKIYFITMAIIFLLSLCDISFANQTSRSKPRPISGNGSPSYTDTEKDGGNPLVNGERDTKDSNDPRDAWDYPADGGDISDTVGIFYEGHNVKGYITYLTVKEIDQNTINAVIKLRKYLQTKAGVQNLDLILKTTVTTGAAGTAIWLSRVLGLHPYGRVASVVAGAGFSGSLLANQESMAELKGLQKQHYRLLEDLANPEISNEEFFSNLEVKIFREYLLGFLNVVYPQLCVGEERFQESQSEFCSAF